LFLRFLLCSGATSFLALLAYSFLLPFGILDGKAATVVLQKFFKLINKEGVLQLTKVKHAKGVLVFSE
jgi:hypothetical protein